jgi:sirohydrochlorin cobaltochelatase
MKRGVLLFAHGARDPRWADHFEEVARRVRQHDPSLSLQLAFLEFMTPSLQDAGQALAADGCGHVDVVPLFLGTGGHVRKDLPELLAHLAGTFPGVNWQLRPAIGEVERVIQAMARAVADFADEREDELKIEPKIEHQSEHKNEGANEPQQ